MRLPRLAPAFLCLLGAVGLSLGADRPNILWITSEDNGPQLGCYGDGFATTPNLDALAKRGMLYLHAWSTAPVCAPARTAIISGLYPSSTGAEHMRSEIPLPAGMRMYPQFLREIGYYCSNNSKEDYNLKPSDRVWDESSPRAHWTNRREGQPFFAVFNHTVTHESQIRKRPHKAVHDPAQVRVPAYHPDVAEVRQDWAQYYDQMSAMDALAGANLRELEDAGLADETIVFYYGDHGPGMPRGKRWLYDSGLRVPLIVYVPPKWRALAGTDYMPGGRSERLVSFVDLAPTVLSLAGLKAPEYLQGRAFLGPECRSPEPYLFGLRGRMDERIDLVRSVRDPRFTYIRNFMPHKIYGQHIAYMFETPTTRVWHELFMANQLEPPRTFFWQTKPPEELYDHLADPDEVRNLAELPEHQDTLRRMREALREHALRIRDVGFLPEAEMHRRSEGTTPYAMARQDERYALPTILAMAERASSLKHEELPELQAGLNDEDSAVRYWAALGLLMRGPDAVAVARDALREALKDTSPSVGIAAAEALAQYSPEDLDAALSRLIEFADVTRQGIYVAVQALNAIDDLDAKAAGRVDALRSLPRKAPSTPPRLDGYISRLLEKILADLGATP
jgi:uncharacterized sulfatase